MERQQELVCDLSNMVSFPMTSSDL